MKSSHLHPLKPWGDPVLFPPPGFRTEIAWSNSTLTLQPVLLPLSPLFFTHPGSSSDGMTLEGEERLICWEPSFRSFHDLKPISGLALHESWANCIKSSGNVKKSQQNFKQRYTLML